jgi:hypothetical protein
MTYALVFYSHQLAAVCVASAWILVSDVIDRRRGLRAMAVAGALAGAAPLVDYQAVFAAVPVAIYAIVRLRARPRGELARLVAVAVVAAAIPIAILLGYHAVCFGSPWRTGYDASTTFAHFHQQGFLGITGFRLEALVGSLVRPDNGLFTLAPWLLLAIPGGYTLARRGQLGVALIGASVAVIYVLFISSINFWRGGWSVGPRYITAMLPFLLPAVAAQLSAWRQRTLLFGIAAGAIIVGVVVYATASATFPYWPDSVSHPLYDLTFRMLGDNLVAPNIGQLVGVAGIAGLTPYLAIVATLLGLTIARAGGLRSLGIAAGVALALLASYALFPRNAYTEQAYRFVRSAVEASEAGVHAQEHM